MRRPPASLLWLSIVFLPAALFADYPSNVLGKNPTAYWRMDSVSEGATPDSGPHRLAATLHGKIVPSSGPRKASYPIFSAENQSFDFGAGASIRVADPGPSSALDVGLGESVTMEAWVRPASVKDGQQVYIVGKGRTKAGQANQNYAMRLRGVAGMACTSFLFRDVRNRLNAGDEDWHRWTSTTGFPVDGAWHHVVVSYLFGKPESIRSWIDGAEVNGSWDMGGSSDLAPVVDDDELWIGSSMAGSAGVTFNGQIDEVAIYKDLPDPALLSAHYRFEQSLPVVALSSLPADGVKVEILERVQRITPEEALKQANVGGSDTGETGANIDPIDASWNSPPDVPTDSYVEPAFGFSRVVARYTPRGVKTDRSSPFMVRASAGILLPPGDHRLLVRALGGARLMMDGRVIATTNFIARRYSDNEAVPDQISQMLVSGVRLLPTGHSEALATVQGDGTRHVLTLEAFVGGKQMRPELGELSVSISTDGGPFRLLSTSAASAALEDGDWTSYVQEQRERIAKLDAQRRSSPGEEAYWAMRRDLARKIAVELQTPAFPDVSPETPVQNEVDRFIGAKLEKAGIQPAALSSDLVFLRRVTLDTVGIIPTSSEMAAFIADQSPDRRSKVIDRLLADPRWADAWVPYWQDVLAENPAILKATLNNTGPFRYWIHESLSDNKPFDRFVTELVSMEGSLHYGGPAGFAMATQNDVPMAAKAQVLSTAFLGVEMKCARCHDAPSHSYNQEDLFGIAAMLQREPLKVPATSSVSGLSSSSPVTVTLEPGSEVDVHWPFTQFPAEPLPGVIRKAGDSRELLAAIITDPRNDRFPQVVVNRIWKRLFSFGLVEPVDDWETAGPSHPELLQWLGRELVLSGYDLKHVTRLILNSHAYQRTITPDGSLERKADKRFFEAQARRRMTAEQLVDSLFMAAGKRLETEELTFDGDARRSIQDFQNLGQPSKAWEFAPLSNERDRPALSLPRAQAILNVMAAYGWRESRPDPRTNRDHDPNVLQPATLANGIMGARITRLSEDSRFTALAMKAESPEALVQDLFANILSRTPTSDETAAMVELLAPGFEGRVLPAEAVKPARRPTTLRAVTWSNHLHADATTVKLAFEEAARAGDPPSPRIEPGWRERAEDAIWALMVSPEFVFIP